MTQQSDMMLEELLAKGIGRGGKKAKALSILPDRELTREDVLMLAEPLGSTSTPIQRLRHSHHMLAKLLGEGRSQVECSQITGYDKSRISILQHDPAFKELVAYYRSLAEEAYVNVHERLASLSIDALEIIHERLVENEDSFELGDLQEVVKLGLDRIGFGPKSTVTHTGGVALLTDEALQRIKDEAERRRTGAVRQLSGPGEFVDSVPVGPSGEVQREEVPAAEGDEGGGADL